MKVSLFIFFANLFAIAVSKSYICTIDHDVTIESDTVYFIESPDFPRPMPDDKRRDCHINFTRILAPGEIKKRFIFVPTNVICSDFDDDDDCRQNIDIYYNETFLYFSLQKSNYYPHPLGYTSFQGYIIFDDWGEEECPMGSISRKDPFQFEDETQIIRLRSNFADFGNRSHPCLWQFSAPKGFGFKVLILSLNISSEIHFTIQNSTVVLATENLVRVRDPYYNNDQYLKISLSGSSINNFQNETEFEAYITLIKNQWSGVELDCMTREVEDGLLWTNSDFDTFGYSNNAFCTYYILISSNTEVRVQGILQLEEFADHIYYYPDGNESRGIEYDAKESSVFALISNGNESDGYVKWEFVSDGSWRSNGFEILFTTFVCSCANKIISVSCYAKTIFHLMETSDNYYCGNLECFFDIKVDSGCSRTNIKMEITMSGNEDDPNNEGGKFFDIFKFTSNNYTQLVIDQLNRNIAQWTVFLSTSMQNSIYALTVPSTSARIFEIVFATFNMPKSIREVELTISTPYYSYYLCSEDPAPNFFLVSLSPELVAKNAFIDMYSASDDVIYSLTFYNNQSLTNRMNFENCFVPLTASELICKTQSQHFLFARHSESDCSVILFQASTESPENCVFQQNVYNLTVTSNLSITAVSKPNKICTIFFLVTASEFKYYFERIWASPTGKDIEIYVGTENKLLASINSKTSLTWRNILMTDLIYIIKIPSNSAVMIDVNFFYQNLIISSFPYNSVVTSPLYGINSPAFQDIDAYIISYNISNYEAEFTVTEFNASSILWCYFITNGIIINITSSPQIETFSEEEIGIFCECQNTDDYYNYNSYDIIGEEEEKDFENEGLNNPCYDSFSFLITVQTLNMMGEIQGTTKHKNDMKITTTTPKPEIYTNNGISNSPLRVIILFSIFMVFNFYIIN